MADKKQRIDVLPSDQGDAPDVTLDDAGNPTYRGGASPPDVPTGSPVTLHLLPGDASADDIKALVSKVRGGR